MTRQPPILCFVFLTLVNLISAETARKPLSAENWPKKLQDGDIVFIRSRSTNSKLIAALSGSSLLSEEDNVFTHCGIVFRKDNTWQVYEGAGHRWILTLKDWQVEEAAKRPPLHNVYVRRWDGKLTPEQLRTILLKAATLHGKDYDFGFSWTDKFSYCSKLVWQAYAAAGLKLVPLKTVQDYLDKLKEADERHGGQHLYERAINTLDKPDARACRGGKPVNPGAQAISPDDIYDSDRLVSVTDEAP